MLPAAPRKAKPYIPSPIICPGPWGRKPPELLMSVPDSILCCHHSPGPKNPLTRSQPFQYRPDTPGAAVPGVRCCPNAPSQRHGRPAGNSAGRCPQGNTYPRASDIPCLRYQGRRLHTPPRKAGAFSAPHSGRRAGQRILPEQFKGGAIKESAASF